MASLGVWLVAVFFLVMGLLALLSPTRFAAPLGLTLVPARGTNEVRAVYGGFGVVMAGLLVYAAGEPALRDGVFLTLALALYGMAAGRVISLVVERAAHPLMWATIATEAGLATILIAVR
jgi:hypothetical protein